MTSTKNYDNGWGEGIVDSRCEFEYIHMWMIEQYWIVLRYMTILNDKMMYADNRWRWWRRTIIDDTKE